MGVLNITPDSFSGDGTGNDLELAVSRARWMADAGADILDIGGESTRPGSTPVSAEEESARVLPVVRAVRSETDVPISIDTYKASVAEAALDAGADMVNDVWALRADPAMAGLVAAKGVPIVLMHNRSDPRHVKISESLGGHYVGMEYDDVLPVVVRELEESIAVARESGVDHSRIVIDPGIGFGKTCEQNLEIMDRLQELRSTGYPVLAGPSRKSFIGLTLDLGPQERIEGTAAAVAVAITRGADIVRVHDVTVMTRVVRMTDAIVRRPPSRQQPDRPDAP
jgi:dihydropteroate synthase